MSLLESKTFRIGGRVLFYLSIFILPWWLSLFLGILLLVFIQAYDVLLGGIAADLLYGVPVAALGGISFLSTILLCAIAIVVFVLRRRLFLYHQ